MFTFRQRVIITARKYVGLVTSQDQSVAMRTQLVVVYYDTIFAITK